jgi:N-methylhydantoinase A
MERAIRRISVERGYDPRLFTLVAFGGAGPLHACEMAANLQIGRVLVPPVPGVLSALGMLAAAPTRDYSQTVMRPAGEGPESLARWLAAAFGPLEQRATAEMTAAGHPPETVTMRPALDMRYTGQSHELTVLLSEGEGYAAVPELFHAAHEQRYGYRQPEEGVEIVTVRLTAVAESRPPRFEPEPMRPSRPEGAVIGRKPVWFDRRPHETTQYDRTQLRPGDHLPGPAVIYQYDTTTIIPPGWQAKVDGYGNLVISNW